MATSALARAFILCVRGPYYEYNGRGYARAMQFSRGQTSVVIPVSDFTVNKELNSQDSPKARVAFFSQRWRP
jgi:hypothetical protein